jgi:hypothetical protein
MFHTIASRLRARRSKNQISISGRDKVLAFSLLHSIHPVGLWNSLSLLSDGYWGLFLRGYSDRSVKLATHFHVLLRLSYTSTRPYALMAQCLIKHRCNFTFRNQFHSWVISTPLLYSGSPGFRSWSKDRLSWLKCSWFYSVLPGNWRDILGHSLFPLAHPLLLVKPMH